MLEWQIKMRKTGIARLVTLLKLEKSDAYYTQQEDLIGAEMQIVDLNSKFVQVSIQKSVNKVKFEKGTILSFKKSATFEPLA